MSADTTIGLFEPRHASTHPFDPYEEELRRSERDKLEVPKFKVPELPERFEENYPANGMQCEDAIASFRDNRENDSVHAIEYPGYWEIHLDRANPRYPNKIAEHLVKDTPGTLVLLMAVVLLYFGDT